MCRYAAAYDGDGGWRRWAGGGRWAVGGGRWSVGGGRRAATVAVAAEGGAVDMVAGGGIQQ